MTMEIVEEQASFPLSSRLALTYHPMPGKLQEYIRWRDKK